jgi:hypothetical protein
MNYELKFYLRQHPDAVQFLRQYQLRDEYTFNQYRNLIQNNVPFSIRFEHYDT